MRPSDAVELVALVLERWPSLRLHSDQQARYAEDVATLDADVARAAVDVIHRDGREWAPTAGEVVRRAAALELAPPEWADVKRSLIERRAALAEHDPPPWECPLDACDGSGFVSVPGRERALARCRCWPDRAACRRLADTLHPLVREFVDSHYVSWPEIDALGSAPGTRDALTLEAQTRGKWELFAGRAVESRALASLGSGAALLRLEQARAEDAPRRRGQLGRPDFAAALAAAHDD